MRKKSDLRSILVQRPLAVGSVVMVCMHFLMLILTVISGSFPIFIVQNLAGLLFYVVMWLLHSRLRVKNEWIILATCIESWMQITVSIFCVGLGGYFQLFYLATLVASFFLTFSVTSERTSFISSLIELGSLILFIAAIIHGQNIEPILKLGENELFITRFVNSLFALLIITYFADCYRLSLVSSVSSRQKAAERDELTGLYNRRGIRPCFDMLHEAWTTAETPYLVAILDIDDFKQVNDTWGHNKGDEVLVEIARVLQRYSSEDTWSCRWGGEEFLILSQVHKSRTANMQVLNRILGDIRQIRIPVEEETIQITATIGCAFSSRDTMIHELLNKADFALYRGKTSGKNQVVPAE